MKALIDVASGKILTVGTATEYGGPWGEGLRVGTLQLVDIPAGERPDELLVVGGVLQVDAAKKAGRIAKETAKSDRRNRLKNADATAGGLPELKAIVQDLLADYRGD